MPTDERPELDPVRKGEELVELLELAERFPARHKRFLDPERVFHKIIERAWQRQSATDNQEVNGE